VGGGGGGGGGGGAALGWSAALACCLGQLQLSQTLGLLPCHLPDVFDVQLGKCDRDSTDVTFLTCSWGNAVGQHRCDVLGAQSAGTRTRCPARGACAELQPLDTPSGRAHVCLTELPLWLSSCHEHWGLWSVLLCFRTQSVSSPWSSVLFQLALLDLWHVGEGA
jgi:hypothetical protein